MLNALKHYFESNKKEILGLLNAMSYTVDPWNTYRLYHGEE